MGGHVRSVQEGAASGEDPAEVRGRLRWLLLFQSEHDIMTMTATATATTTTTTMVVVVVVVVVRFN